MNASHDDTLSAVSSARRPGKPGSILASLFLFWSGPWSTAQAQDASTAPAANVSPHPSSTQEAAQRFELAGKFALEIDGVASLKAQTFVSLASGSELLVRAPELGQPLLLKPRGKSLHRIPLSDLQSHGGFLEFTSDSPPEPVGTYAIDRTSLVWDIDGLSMRLTERHLFGLHAGAALGAWDPEYVRRADRYTPSQPLLDSLAATTEEARIRVYFGSWCPRCGHAVPRLMRLESELANSKLRFEFFGMPQLEADAPETFWQEAKDTGAYEDDVTIVPLAIVFRGDQRLGRITSGWSAPERELEKILAVSPADTSARSP